MRTPQGATSSYSYANVNFGTSSWSAISSKSNSLGTWSYAYSPSTSTGAYDVTTVILPSGLGTITYRHFGMNTVSSGEVWKVGSLYQRQI